MLVSSSWTARDRARALWAFAAGAAFFAYALLWWTSYVAPNNGNELYVMSEGAHGRYPYRDYFWVQPPGMPLLFLASQRLFGVHLLPFYGLSLAVRALATSALAWTLSARRSVVLSALASAAAAMASCNDDGEYIAHYSHWATSVTVLMIVGLYPWFVGDALSPRRMRAHAWLAGAAAGILLVSKQTAGIVENGVVVLAVALLAACAPRRRAAMGALVRHGLVGFAVPVGATAAWLASLGALTACVRDTFVTGPSAKGGGGAAAVRLFTAPFQVPHMGAECVVAALVLGLPVAWLLARRAAPMRRTRRAVDGAFGLVAIGAVVAAAWAWIGAVMPPAYLFARAVSYAAILGTLAFALVVVLQVIAGRDDDDVGHRYVTVLVSFGAVYALSASWGAMEFMVFPALAVAAVELAHAFRQRSTAPHARLVVTVALLGWVGAGAWLRLSMPYRWSYWREGSVLGADTRSREPGLVGFTMHEETAAFIDATAAVIRRASDRDEPVVAFPHLLLLPALADRRVFGDAPMLFFDVCPDALAHRAAERLRIEPPPVLVFQDLPPAIVAEQEALFRGGATSGQRAFVASLQALRASGAYAEVGTFGAKSAVPIRVLVRVDRLERLMGPAPPG